MMGEVAGKELGSHPGGEALGDNSVRDRAAARAAAILTKVLLLGALDGVITWFNMGCGCCCSVLCCQVGGP